MTHVKICCISSVQEAALAVRAGASALGLVSEMPSGPGVVTEATIAEIVATVPAEIATFLLTSRTTADEMIAQQLRCGNDTIQICDRVAPQVHHELREALPEVSLVQVVHVTGESSVSEALDCAERVDMILLDSGDQSLDVKELGGTGRTHDWQLSAEIVERCPVPVFLAGGLRESNVADAIRAVRPHGLDLCTGVRTQDALDEAKLRRFMEAVRAMG